MSEIIFVDFKKRQVIKIEKRESKSKAVLPDQFADLFSGNTIGYPPPPFCSVNSMALQFEAEIPISDVQQMALESILQSKGWTYEELVTRALGKDAPPPMKELTFKQAVMVIEFGNAHMKGT